MLFGKKKSVAGLDVGSSSIKIVELDGKMNNLSLIGLGFENLPADTVVDGQIMELNTVSEVINNICSNHQIDASQVVTGVSGHSVIIKNIVLPPMSREELEESIDWHAEEHIPYDLSDVSLDYQVTVENSEATHVLIAAVKRERIDNIKQAIQLAGRQPVVIDVSRGGLGAPRGIAPLYAVSAQEISEVPNNEEPIDWVLLTTKPTYTFADACSVIIAYASRWRIEEVHKSWKSVTKIEDSETKRRNK